MNNENNNFNNSNLENNNNNTINSTQQNANESVNMSSTGTGQVNNEQYKNVQPVNSTNNIEEIRQNTFEQINNNTNDQRYINDQLNINQNTEPNNQNTNTAQVQTNTVNNNSSIKNNILKENLKQLNNNGKERIAIKKDAKTKPKKEIILSSILISIISVIIVVIMNMVAAQISSIISILSSIISVCLIYILSIGILPNALKISRNENVTIKDIIIWPFKNIKRVLSTLLVVMCPTILVIIIDSLIMRVIGIGFISSLLLMIINFINIIIILPMTSIISLYILDEHNQEKNLINNIKNGYNLIKNNILELSALSFSFVLWTLLVPITLGIIMLWLIPYMIYSVINFYKKLLKEATFDGTETGMSDKAIFIIEIVLMIISALSSASAIGSLSLLFNSISGSYNISSYKPTTIKPDYGKYKENELTDSYISPEIVVTFNKTSKYEADEYNTISTKEYKRDKRNYQINVELDVQSIYYDSDCKTIIKEKYYDKKNIKINKTTVDKKTYYYTNINKNNEYANKFEKFYCTQISDDYAYTVNYTVDDYDKKLKKFELDRNDNKFLKIGVRKS